jgi:hypothetical protein
MFLAAFAGAGIAGACGKLEDPAASAWSKIHLTNAEALGCGTIASDVSTGQLLPTCTPCWASMSAPPPATPATC